MDKSLKIISQHHNEWINIVKTFGENLYYEDIVQEMYLRFYKYAQPEKIINKGKVNKSYIWIMLRNCYFDQLRINKRLPTIKIDACYKLETDEDNTDKIETYKAITNKVSEEAKKWHYFDRLLFQIYKDTDLSMRQLSTATGISLKTIFNTLKHCKERVKRTVGEDYEDYKNEDYELIKK